MCDCGCNTCEDKKAIMLNESLVPKEILSEGLKYHMDNNVPLTEHVYRAGSQKYFDLWAEARALYSRNILDVDGDDLEVLTETDLGHYGMFEGKKVPLDFPIELTEAEKLTYNDFVQMVRDDMMAGASPDEKPSEEQVKKKAKAYYNDYLQGASVDSLFEAKYQGKEVKLNKPKRGGSKKFFVYVKDPKTGKVKKISFGDTTGLKVKLNDPKARKAFSKRHDCPNKKDKTKASYWSCRLPRYAKLLGLKSSFSGFW